MNFYAFHIGDYQSHTSHLSPMEDLAYRRMIDRYYLSEKPLPLDPGAVARLIGMRDQVEIVSDILSEFFVKSEHGWTSSRCDQEIAKYREKADRARKANDTRWQKKAEDRTSPSDLDLKSESDQIPTITITNTKDSTKRARRRACDDVPVVVPDVLNTVEFTAVWSEYIGYRKTMGFKTLKSQSIQRTYDQLAKWGHDSAIQSIQNSIRNGWQGIFEPRTQANAVPDKNNEFTHAF